MNARLKRIFENADGMDVYQCRECGAYWVHVGDFTCMACGSKSADQVQPPAQVSDRG